MIFQELNPLVPYIQACSDETKANYLMPECGLQQMSCNLFPKIGTNELMAVKVSRLHCLVRQNRRALMGRGRLQRKPESMVSRGHEERRKEAMTT